MSLDFRASVPRINTPLPASHSQIESQIESFVESFKKNGSVFTNKLNAESCSSCPPESSSQVTSLGDSTYGNLTRSMAPSSQASSSCFDSSSCDDVLISDTDETMEENGSNLTVKEVEELLYTKYAIITGGRTPEGWPIITFPDLGLFYNLYDEDYRKLMLYLTAIPSMQDADLGFALIVDRRNDKWSAVKTILLRISGFFPGLIQIVFVLRPVGFFQKAISEVSHKLFKEEFKFKLIVCSTVDELHEHLDPSQLTEDLGGTISYNHDEWIEQRMVVEKFSANLQEISSALRDMTQKLQETELPNDVSSTLSLLKNQETEYKELKDELRSAARHGETLLNCIRRPSSETASLEMCPDKLINVTAVERLLVQLDETEKGFDNFWSEHENKLSQFLELRKFEHEFKELQVNVTTSLQELTSLPESGDSVSQIDFLIEQLEKFRLQTKNDFDRMKEIQEMGKSLIMSKHYAIDCVSPKCLELERMFSDFKQKLDQRYQLLHKHRDLQERIEKANKWCTEGVDLLANLEIEKCSSPEFALVALEELDSFLKRSQELQLSSPREFHNIFKDMITPEIKSLVHQVIQRIEDVQVMCETQKNNLQKFVSRSSRPVQAVIPEPAVPLSLPSIGGGSNIFQRGSKSPDNELRSFRRGKTGSKMHIEVRLGEFSSILPSLQENCSLEPHSPSSYSQQDMKNHKRGHVMTELIETEKTYVSELNSIIEGYKKEMDNPAMKDCIPGSLFGKSDVLFGNMMEIYNFHNNIFLMDLQNCSSTPELVGRCFVQRRDFLHKLYSTYCMNKPKSEALRRQCGDDNLFFKECQKKLEHKLPLGAYLLKPVQRITKYQLLIKDLLKYTDEKAAQGELQEALDAMLSVLKYVNDSMHQVAITGFHRHLSKLLEAHSCMLQGSLADYGKLLLQGPFNVWIEGKKDRIRDLRFKSQQRFIFLYEQLILLTKKCGPDENPTYAFKNALKTSQIGLTETLKGSRGDSRKFEVWLHGRTQVFIIQAPTVEVKNTWVKAIKKVLLQQFEDLKGESKKNTDKVPRLFTKARKTVPGAFHRSKNTVGSLSWDNCPMITENNHPNVHHPPELERRATLPTICYHGHRTNGMSHSESHDDGWSTDDFSQTEDEDEDSDVFACRTEIGTSYQVLGDYEAVDVSETSLTEGQIVMVERVGCAGWWYVRDAETGAHGWVPASYLGLLSEKPCSHSTPSVSSQDSGSGSLNHAVSRTSVTSMDGASAT
ncbi:guanine nucleotide exchange factor DBS-like isoform X5 [Tachypleus tridentatus]|uniref:guanine nucleotide exchange factor DBS-like isoform X5 n=1 Tax=Tachypleus tridentatus TaxID=6853 RepID=UPI003FD641E4